MAYFLAKSDPSEYSIEDLERDGKTEWDGVRNPQAVRAIREMKPGDKVFIYHSGGESLVKGLASVSTTPRQDANTPKSWVVDFEFLEKLEPPVTLSEIKQSGQFAQWALVRQPRLSTMTVPANFVQWMRERYPKVKI